MSVAALRLTARAGFMRASTIRLSSNAANLPGAHSTVPKISATESISESLQVQQQYNNPTDHATSEASAPTTLPVNHPEDGPLAAASISGAPVDLQGRTVRIYKKSKPATQSSNWPGEVWTLDWDTMGKGGRWENPLMGWASSSDYMQGTALKFKSKEDAIRFAEKQGYEYFVQEPNVRAFRPKAYAANFTHVPGPLKIVRTK